MDQRTARGGMAGVGYVIGVLALVGGIAAGAWWFSGRNGRGDNSDTAFADIMSSGKTLYERGEPARAIEAFQRGLVLNPANPDARLNLANAYLLAGQAVPAAAEATEALRYEPGNAAALYVLGCSLLRQNQYSNAVQSLSDAKAADPTENPVSFQLGRAYLGWGRFEDAAGQFREVLQFDTNHPAANYLLSQSLLRLGQREEAQAALAEHQRINAGKVGNADNPALYERSKYTAIRAPFSLEQPDPRGVPVRLVDDTARAFAGAAATLHGPLALLDINRRGANDLLLVSPAGARVFLNSNGVFAPRDEAVSVTGASNVAQVLVGDLQNDRFEDTLILTPEGASLLRFATNGGFTDVTGYSGLRQAKVAGRAGALADLDFTGKLGLLIADPDGRLRGFTNLGTGVFRERRPPASGPDPLAVTAVTQITVDDLNNDDLPDVLLTRSNLPPHLLLNLRGGGLSATNQPSDWPIARGLATGDFNNDLRTDVVLATAGAVELRFGGLKEPRRLAARGNQIERVRALDYDNDGWLDVVAWGGDGLHVWRNRGSLGFEDTTTALGLDSLQGHPVLDLAAADFDGDCDQDWIVDVGGEGLKFLRNDGGSANGLLKLRLLGNRSNASALGIKVELASGGWHTLRTVQQLPMEIGIGKRSQLDLVSTRWFDTKLDTTEVTTDCKVPLTVFELVLPTGSCPYLYAWDGTRHRFITDLLGAAPVGLPVAPGRFIEADPDELVRIGSEREFQPRDGHYELQLTEELREILYLDTARLLAVDHPAGTEVFSTGKLVPGRPFPKSELLQLGGRQPLRSAVLSPTGSTDARDVTTDLTETDGVRVSPLALRGTHYRGLAEPFGITLDFGELATDRPLVLALTGWLRFGGGMANIAAAHNPDFPFPFPVLEAETPRGWQPVDVTVGAPAGKTKGIVVDLTGRLPAGARRLRLSQAFEIHWDRIALFTESAKANATALNPTSSDLHWRGYSEFENRPWTDPLTPDYTRVKSSPPWRITPSGWATRYGPVDELLAEDDNGLAVIAGGDELTLKFATAQVPAKADGVERDFFLFTTGWDKDADYHVARGTTIEPLPWRDMDDQRHGQESRPGFPSDALHERFNTRWVGEKTFSRRGGK
ncbi:MAG: hypothetical protein RIS76_2284 [Verrucomicrobiota bacterium]